MTIKCGTGHERKYIPTKKNYKYSTSKMGQLSKYTPGRHIKGVDVRVYFRLFLT